jgi:hypothetical protein
MRLFWGLLEKYERKLKISAKFEDWELELAVTKVG